MSEGTERDVTADSAREGRYRAVIERYGDEPNQCTIFPGDVADDERVTRWISAAEPSYVDLWAVR